MILWRPAGRASQQLGFGQLLANHAMHGAAQSFHRPVMTSAIEGPHDIVPAMLWAKLPNGRKPGLGRGDQLVEIEFFPSLRYPADH